MTETEKKVRDFCTRQHLSYEWQDLKNFGKRAVVETLDRNRHTTILRAAHHLCGVTVIDWTRDMEGIFNGRIFFRDAADMVRITQAEYDTADEEFKGVWMDYYGDRPEWKGRRTIMIAEYGTRVFIEGVTLEIV